MKKRSKLFSHFVAILHALALAIPLIAFAVVSLQDALPKWFSSQAVQHHGGTNDEFSDDLDYSLDNLQTRTMNQNLFHTLDELNYLNYQSSTGQVYKKVDYPSNVVNSNNDLIVGNYYRINITNSNYDYFYNYFEDNSLKTDFFYITYFEDIEDYYLDDSDSELGTTLLPFYWTSIYQFNFYQEDIGYGLYIYPTCRVGYIDEDNDINYYKQLIFSILLTPQDSSIILQINEDTFDEFNAYTNSDDSELYTFFSPLEESDISILPPHYELISEGGDISTFDEYMEYYQNANFSTIVSEGTKNNFIFNFDFISLFNQSVVNNGDSIATLLFINFYLNYIINISLIIFLPEVIMVFFDICRKFVYKFTDMGDKY